MFSLHETTQRLVCRVLFIVFCVMPTIATFGWVAFFYRPWRTDDWQQHIAEQLHVSATVETITKPCPGSTNISRVEFADLSSNQKLGCLTNLDLSHEGSTLILKADRLEIECNQFRTTIKALGTWISCKQFNDLELDVKELLLVNKNSMYNTWNNLRITSKGRSSRINLQFESNLADSPVQLLVERTTKKDAPTINLHLDTKTAILPTWLIDGLLFGNKNFTKTDSYFSGKIYAAWAPGQITGTLTGKFSEIDLDRWLVSSVAHRLKSITSLQLDKLIWRNRTIVTAEGRLVCQAGSMSYSLVNAIKDVWSCEPTENLNKILAHGQTAMLSFEEISAGFKFNESGIKILGESSPGCLMSGKDGPLLMEPKQPLPIASLVQLLYIPNKGWWLPSTKEAHDMASRLPLPSGKK